MVSVLLGHVLIDIIIFGSSDVVSVNKTLYSSLEVRGLQEKEGEIAWREWNVYVELFV